MHLRVLDRVQNRVYLHADIRFFQKSLKRYGKEDKTRGNRNPCIGHLTERRAFPSRSRRIMLCQLTKPLDKHRDIVEHISTSIQSRSVTGTFLFARIRKYLWSLKLESYLCKDLERLRALR